VQPQIVSRLLALIAIVQGLPSVAGAVFFEDVTPLLRTSTFAAGTLLLLAGWLLFQFKRSALPVLWLSLVIYLASIFYPTFQRHGPEVLSALLPAFYWSMLVRLALVIGAHLVLKQREASSR
jgi:hypothetical protein